ncbi:MAG: OmpA family protein [Nitrospiraceae bacterium]|jgi:peptidoglycan-associated lipoprotein|nr:OmpA family protein [Nitrospiraceae bacterium]OQW66851.1 MAG: hypothetical protein BVN29_04180 [Nitrospira sp. ST-bin5]
MTTKSQPQAESIQPDRITSIEPPADNRPLQSQETRNNQLPSATQAGGHPSNGMTSLQETRRSPDGSGLRDIYFDFDQYNIRTDAQSALEDNGQWMRRESGRSILIEGHCDERGTLAYNLVLGEKRAKSAKRYLENFGIPSSRLHTTSYGEVKPACKEHNEGCWKYNRRAHFVVQ